MTQAEIDEAEQALNEALQQAAASAAADIAKANTPTKLSEELLFDKLSVMHGNKFTRAVNVAYNQANIDF